MKTLGRFLGWLVRHPWAIVLAALILMVLYARAEVRSLHQEVQELRSAQAEGFRTLEAGIAQRPAPVIVPGPSLNPFDDEDTKWDLVFVELNELRKAVKDAGTDPHAVAVVRAEIPGDSLTWRIGETVTTQRFSVYPLDPDRYRLDLYPSRLRVAMSRGTDGQWFAQVFDEAAGVPLTVSTFDVHEQEPGLRWEWFRWRLGGGYGSDLEGGTGPMLWGEVSLLRLGRPGGLSWKIGTLAVDPYSARLGVSVGN